MNRERLQQGKGETPCHSGTLLSNLSLDFTERITSQIYSQNVCAPLYTKTMVCEHAYEMKNVQLDVQLDSHCL